MDKQKLKEYIGWFLVEDSFPSASGKCELCGVEDDYLLQLGDPKGRESEDEPEFYLICHSCAGNALSEYEGIKS